MVKSRSFSLFFHGDALSLDIPIPVKSYVTLSISTSTYKRPGIFLCWTLFLESCKKSCTKIYISTKGPCHLKGSETAVSYQTTESISKKLLKTVKFNHQINLWGRDPFTTKRQTKQEQLQQSSLLKLNNKWLNILTKNVILFSIVHITFLCRPQKEPGKFTV